MKVQWIAHSCFKVFLNDGRTLLFDPFESSIGYECPETEADIVFVSHDHFDHNYTACVKGEYKLFNAPVENAEVDGISIKGLECSHGGDRGKVTIFKVKAEGLTLVHLGDIGEIPSEELYKEIEDADILFIPVGSIYTINAEQAFEIAKRIEPNIIFPMHYKTLFLNIPLDSVYHFTDAASEYFDRSHVGGNTFELNANDKKKRPRIIIMENSLDC